MWTEIEERRRLCVKREKKKEKAGEEIRVALSPVSVCCFARFKANGKSKRKVSKGSRFECGDT